jgi:hypothetical protein
MWRKSQDEMKQPQFAIITEALATRCALRLATLLKEPPAEPGADGRVRFVDRFGNSVCASQRPGGATVLARVRCRLQTGRGAAVELSSLCLGRDSRRVWPNRSLTSSRATDGEASRCMPAVMDE